jgi:hypothetical protein
MRSNRRKIQNAVKTTIFGMALLICILSAIFSSQWKNEKQTLDMKTAAVVSIGLGTAIELFTIDKKYL